MWLLWCSNQREGERGRQPAAILLLVELSLLLAQFAAAPAAFLGQSN